jgi:predicted nucleic acid-binding protein
MATRTAVKHYFFDSSSFLKLFIVEAGDSRIREIVHAAQSKGARVKVSVCDLAHPECVAAMRQMLERGVGGRRGISPAAFRRTLPELATIAKQGSVLGIVRASDVVEHAAELAARVRLKGADCVHLAAAQSVRHEVPEGEEFWFVSADQRQVAAARREGMLVLDPIA